MKHMKYLITAVFVILLLTLPAHAADGVGLKIEAAPPQAAPGDQVTMTFSLTGYADGDDLIRGLQLTVSGIDPEVLTVESCRTLISDPSVSGKQNLATFQQARGQVNLTYAPLAPSNQTTYVPLDGLLEIVFRVADDAQGGSIDLQVQRDIVFQSGPDRSKTTVSAAWSAKDGCYDLSAYAGDGWNGDRYYENGVMYTGVRAVDGVWYDFGEDGVSKGKYTGLVDIDGVNYYAKFGELASGWFDVDGEWYYFVPETMAGANGEVKTTDNVTFSFDNGKVLDGTWVVSTSGGLLRYWYGPSYYKITSKNVPYLVQEIHGNTYLFNQNGYMQTGIKKTHRSNEITPIWYDCGEDGVAVKLAGPMLVDFGGKTYYVNAEGESPDAGLVQVDGNYYFVIYDGTVKKDADRYVNHAKANGLVPEGNYHFDADGKMVLKNGVIDGYYYENNEIVKDAGLVKVGDDYYFVIYSGAVKKDADRYVNYAKANGLVPEGMYHFDEEGKMVKPQPKNGVIDGYYYVDNELVKDAGLVKVGDDYYFVIYSGAVKKDADRYVNHAKANGLVPEGMYHFDEEGKMVIPEPPEVKNGIVDGYYYVNGELVKDAGLVKVGDDYYFVIYSGAVKKDADRYVNYAKANGLVPEGLYHFDEEGKMVNPPV